MRFPEVFVEPCLTMCMNNQFYRKDTDVHHPDVFSDPPALNFSRTILTQLRKVLFDILKRWASNAYHRIVRWQNWRRQKTGDGDEEIDNSWAK